MQRIITVHVNHYTILFKAKEPKILLNNKCDLTNNFIRVRKKRISLDCKRFLNLKIIGHRASSKNGPYFVKGSVLLHGIFGKYVFKIYGNIDNQNTSLQLSNNIINSDKDCFKRDINDLILFYSVEKDNLNLVR